MIDPVEIGPPTVALHDGTCCLCDDVIYTGDQVCGVDYGWAHLDCCDGLIE